MESHIMNVPYHHTRYRPIGHKIMRATSESLSSESSCTQNSPEYPQPQPEFDRTHYEEEQENDWNVNNHQAVSIFFIIYHITLVSYGSQFNCHKI